MSDIEKVRVRELKDRGLPKQSHREGCTMSVLDELTEAERELFNNSEYCEYFRDTGGYLEDLKILTHRDGRRFIGWRSPLAKKWTSDGYEVLEEISRAPANEDAPFFLMPDMRERVYFWHEDGSETCLRVDPEGNFTTWRTQIVKPSGADTPNGLDGTKD
jgi:hypothetical protein